MPCIPRSFLGLAPPLGPFLQFVTDGAAALRLCDRTLVPFIPRSLLGLALSLRRRALSTVCHRRRRRAGVMWAWFPRSLLGLVLPLLRMALSTVCHRRRRCAVVLCPAFGAVCWVCCPQKKLPRKLPRFPREGDFPEISQKKLSRKSTEKKTEKLKFGFWLANSTKSPCHISN